MERHVAMARRPRIHYPGGLYHVIARGNRGLRVFRRDQDYSLYLKFLEEYKERYDFLLYAYEEGKMGTLGRKDGDVGANGTYLWKRIIFFDSTI